MHDTWSVAAQSAEAPVIPVQSRREEQGSLHLAWQERQRVDLPEEHHQSALYLCSACEATRTRREPQHPAARNQLDRIKADVTEGLKEDQERQSKLYLAHASCARACCAISEEVGRALKVLGCSSDEAASSGRDERKQDQAEP